MDADVPPPESAPIGATPLDLTLPGEGSAENIGLNDPSSPTDNGPDEFESSEGSESAPGADGSDGPGEPDPPVEPADLPDSGPPLPAVVAVVVARGEAVHLDACLASLAATDYPALTVVVIGVGTTDLASRVAATLPTAFVRSIDAAGFAAGANEALTTVAGAPFLLFCHDDTICDPSAVRVMVAEAYRSNAAILGPKIVDPERPEVLREVGWSVDRFAVPHSEIQLDELDQEQHDAVRDVFFVSDACMLVRADLLAELGGFDPECDPGATALDLCWRARLAGARVLVAPDARVRHFDADNTDVADDLHQRRVHRHRIRVLLTSTSAWRLCWIVPLAFTMHLAESVAFVVQRRASRASALMGAWVWNVRRLGSLHTARRRAQGARVVGDSELRGLQYHGSARVTAYVTTSLQAPDRVRSLSERGRTVADTANSSLRTWRGILAVVVVAVAVVGTRDLLLGRVAAVGQLAPWPDIGELLRNFTSEWRSAGLGSQSAAPPAFAIAAVLQFLAFGSAELARALLLVGAIPLGMVGTYHAARRIAGAGWPAAIGAIVYGIVALPRNAIEQGHLGSLALYVAAPFVLIVVFQLADVLPMRWPRRRVAGLGAVVLGLAVAWWPPALALPVVIGVGVAVAAAFTGDSPRVVRRCFGAAFWVSGLAALVLIPWPLSFIASGDRLGALGIVDDPVSSFGNLLRFMTGSNGAGIAGWSFVVVGVIVAALAAGERGVWCARLWGMALVSWVLAAMPAWLDVKSPAVDGVLVPAALAMALLAGLGVAIFFEEVRTRGLGWEQIGATVAAGLLAIGALGFLGDAADGRFRQPSSDWNETLAWMRTQRDVGPSRVLWLGEPDAVPGAVHRAGRDAYSLTVDGPGDLTDLLPAPGGEGAAAVSDALASLRDGTTSRFGATIAPMAVRYVVVPRGAAPGESSSPTSARFVASFAGQLDLRELQAIPGVQVYENTVWVPGDARLANGPKDATGSDVPVAAAPEAEAGLRLWSQLSSDSWEARASGRGLERRQVFGWTNGFVDPGPGPVDVSFARQWWRWIGLAVQLAIVGWLARRVLRGRRRRGPVAPPELPASDPDSVVNA